MLFVLHWHDGKASQSNKIKFEDFLTIDQNDDNELVAFLLLGSNWVSERFLKALIVASFSQRHDPAVHQT